MAIHRTYVSQPRGRALTVNIAVLGAGNIGREFITQVLDQADYIRGRELIDLRIFAIGTSSRLLLSADGVGADWEALLRGSGEQHNISEQIIAYAHQHKLQHLILVDNTASEEVARAYTRYCLQGFNIVSSSKRANTLPWADYCMLHQTLVEQDKIYRYETNVGAGLPLIDNIKMLHLSGERIHRIYGVFSGSLSYIFNTLSDQPDLPLRQVIDEALRRGFAEPDVREDLCGLDVARKVLILARELDISADLGDVTVENLVPEVLRDVDYATFQSKLSLLERYIKARLSACTADEVLRYVGQVTWDDATQQSTLRAGLMKLPRTSSLAALSDADCGFEIYTESYGHRPIVVQGAGAGTKVTARGVFGDVLRIADSL